jgi:hypothetical protein
MKAWGEMSVQGGRASLSSAAPHHGLVLIQADAACRADHPPGRGSREPPRHVATAHA